MSRGEAPCPPEVFFGLLAEQAPRSGVSLAETALERLARYLSELDRWRRTTNLTGRLSTEELVAHALESAVGERFLPPAARLLDIGSGAGFPAIPLAIARPDLRVTALEARRKRIDFLRHCARAVPVENIAPLHGRLEALAPAERFDAASSRAVGAIARLLDGAPFLEPGGAFLAWTTTPTALAAALSPALLLELVEPLPGSHRRVIALFRKTAR